MEGLGLARFGRGPSSAPLQGLVWGGPLASCGLCEVPEGQKAGRRAPTGRGRGRSMLSASMGVRCHCHGRRGWWELMVVVGGGGMGGTAERASAGVALPEISPLHHCNSACGVRGRRSMYRYEGARVCAPQGAFKVRSSSQAVPSACQCVQRHTGLAVHLGTSADAAAVLRPTRLATVFVFIHRYWPRCLPPASSHMWLLVVGRGAASPYATSTAASTRIEAARSVSRRRRRGCRRRQHQTSSSPPQEARDLRRCPH